MPQNSNALPNPWKALMIGAAAVAGLGLCCVLAWAALEQASVWMLGLGITVVVFMGGAWAFARSRAALVEPELAQLRRGEWVMRWDMEPAQWADFNRARRARARAWVLGGAAGVSVLPMLLLGVAMVGPEDVRWLGAWIGWGLAGLWTLALGIVVAAGRGGGASEPVLFSPKACAIGRTLFAWPHGIARIELEEEHGVLLLTRKGAFGMPATTFTIPVPSAALDDARSLLPEA